MIEGTRDINPGGGTGCITPGSGAGGITPGGGGIRDLPEREKVI